eukprot:Opistho-2@48982
MGNAAAKAARSARAGTQPSQFAAKDVTSSASEADAVRLAHAQRLKDAEAAAAAVNAPKDTSLVAAMNKLQITTAANPLTMSHIPNPNEGDRTAPVSSSRKLPLSRVSLSSPFDGPAAEGRLNKEHVCVCVCVWFSLWL